MPIPVFSTFFRAESNGYMMPAGRDDKRKSSFFYFTFYVKVGLYNFRKGLNNMMKPAKNSLDLGVITNNFPASLNFYQNILGLEYVEATPLWFGLMHRLRFGTSDFKLIEPKTIPAQGPTGVENQSGFRYVTFVIEDLPEFCAYLHKQGVEFIVPATEIRPGVSIAMVKDPDGNTVEFVEHK
jgi:glyoxylase I family protein